MDAAARSLSDRLGDWPPLTWSISSDNPVPLLCPPLGHLGERAGLVARPRREPGAGRRGRPPSLPRPQDLNIRRSFSENEAKWRGFDGHVAGSQWPKPACWQRSPLVAVSTHLCRRRRAAWRRQVRDESVTSTRSLSWFDWRGGLGRVQDSSCPGAGQPWPWGAFIGRQDAEVCVCGVLASNTQDAGILAPRSWRSRRGRFGDSHTEV